MQRAFFSKVVLGVAAQTPLCRHFKTTTKPVAMIDIECNFINCYCESDTGLYHNCGIANQIEGGYYIRFIKVLSKPFH